VIFCLTKKELGGWKNSKNMKEESPGQKQRVPKAFSGNPPHIIFADSWFSY